MDSAKMPEITGKSARSGTWTRRKGCPKACKTIRAREFFNFLIPRFSNLLPFSYFRVPKINSAMAVTRLKRKNRKDKAKSAVRRQTLKNQNFKPVIKNIDIEEIKKEFDGKTKKK